MFVLKHLAAAVILILWPAAAGLCLGTLCKWKNRILPGFSGFYAEGTVLMLALFEVCFLIISSMGKGLDQLVILWWMITAVFFVAGAAFCIKQLSKRDDGKNGDRISENVFRFDAGNVDKSCFVSAGIVFAVTVILMLLQSSPVSGYMYSSAETTVSVLSTRSFFGIDPLTGLMSNDILPNDRVWGLPAFYACLCRMTRIAVPWYLLKYIIPCWVLLTALFVMTSAAQLILGKKVKTVYFIFLLAVVFSGGSNITPFYDLTNMAWEGRTYISFLILPAAVLMICSLLTKKERRKPAAVLVLCIELLFASALAEGIGSGMVLTGASFAVSVICLIFTSLHKLSET